MWPWCRCVGVPRSSGCANWTRAWRSTWPQPALPRQRLVEPYLPNGEVGAHMQLDAKSTRTPQDIYLGMAEMCFQRKQYVAVRTQAKSAIEADPLNEDKVIRACLLWEKAHEAMGENVQAEVELFLSAQIGAAVAERGAPHAQGSTMVDGETDASQEEDRVRQVPPGSQTPPRAATPPDQLTIAFPAPEPPRLIDPPDPVFKPVPEGRVREVIRNERERNRDIAAKKKQAFIQQHGRLFCEVCGWEPPTALGAAAHSAIEGHHNDPIADSDPDRTTAIDDLSLVCGNCHALLHSSEKVLTLQELKSLLQTQ